MPLRRQAGRYDKQVDVRRRPQLFEDLLTGLSLGVFVILLGCVLVGAWLYESGV